jgi:hypothetical protein
MENMRHHVFSFHEKMTFYFTYTPWGSLRVRALETLETLE